MLIIIRSLLLSTIFICSTARSQVSMGKLTKNEQHAFETIKSGINYLKAKDTPNISWKDSAAWDKFFSFYSDFRDSYLDTIGLQKLVNENSSFSYRQTLGIQYGLLYSSDQHSCLFRSSRKAISPEGSGRIL